MSQKRNSAKFACRGFSAVCAFRYPVLSYTPVTERRQPVTLGGEGWSEPGPFDAPIDYDRVADVYDLYVTSYLDVGFYVAEADKVKGKVLELMCGTGRASMPLLEAGVDLTCVDASEGILARALKRGCTRASSRPGC